MADAELDRFYQCPMSFVPGKMSWTGQWTKIPRKLKKRARLIPYEFLSLEQKLWYLLSIEHPDYHAFLIKKVVEAP